MGGKYERHGGRTSFDNSAAVQRWPEHRYARCSVIPSRRAPHQCLDDGPRQRLQAAEKILREAAWHVKEEHRQAVEKLLREAKEASQTAARNYCEKPLDQAECDALAAHVSTYGPPLSQQVAEELRARVALLSEEIKLSDVSRLLSEIADSAHIDSKHQECAKSQIRLMQKVFKWSQVSHRRYEHWAKMVDNREAPIFAVFAQKLRQTLRANHKDVANLDRTLDQAECDALAAHVSTYGPPLSQQVAEELPARVALLSEEIQLQDVSGLLSEIADSAHTDSKHQECAESQIRLMQAMRWPISHRRYGKSTKYVDRREAPAFAAFASHAHQLVSNEELLHDSGPLDDAVTSSVVKIQAWWRGYAAMARVERIIQSLEPNVEEPWCPYPMANPVTICTGTPNQSGMSTSPTPTVPSTLPWKAYEQCI